MSDPVITLVMILLMTVGFWLCISAFFELVMALVERLRTKRRGGD